MKKLRKILSNLLLEFDWILLRWAAKLDPPTATKGLIGYKVSDVPHSFSSFKEGMESADYCTRHDAAGKLVGWYLYSGGHPLVEELVRAAEIMLEDSSATDGDVSFLVGAWKDQASATTDEEREAAEERENAIYTRVSLPNTTKN
jgi:hypothetical protein